MPAGIERRRTVRTEGAELAVFEHGPSPAPGVPSLLLVHGYPDDHRLYLPLITELAATHHVVAYDTRNAGLSSVTETPGNFTLEALVSDLFAVLESMGEADVHLVGHDWGSIQGWAAIQDPRAAGRIGHYTSISGPDLGHFIRWIVSRARTPPALAAVGGATPPQQLRGRLSNTRAAGGDMAPLPHTPLREVSRTPGQ